MEGGALRSSLEASLPGESTEAEVLTGAQLFLHVLRTNESQRQALEERISSYTNLHQTLLHLNDKSRLTDVLAPVASGLAYFNVTIKETNRVVVLLGDKWFAERSALQAAAIAERRLSFLRRESQVLETEKRNLEARQDLFLREMEGAEEALARVVLDKEEGLRSVAAGGLTGERMPTTEGGTATETVARESERREENKINQGNPKGEGEHTEDPLADPALTTFDEQDGLTEEELIAIEVKLGEEDMFNDELVEKLMLEKMIEKKEKRVKAELEARKALKQKEEEERAAKQIVQESVKETPPAAAARPLVSPADIGANYRPPSHSMEKGQTEATTTTTTTTTAAAASSKETKKKSVSFSPLPTEIATTTTTAAVTETADPGRKTATIQLGGIVERSVGETPYSGVRPAPNRNKKKKKISVSTGNGG